MFEKDEHKVKTYAEFIAKKHASDLELIYRKGVLDGYNNANEWHYVKDGDLPKDARYVWTNVGAGYYDSSDHCWRDDFGRLQNVIAWCEPKFEG